ncbi:MAG: nucleotidyltransferase domain-containing protein [Deltaproteobacteria bacterium]|nr:nucleotidyltransferase domain-containing protein [Deltaproteobacteria bacterium]
MENDTHLAPLLSAIERIKADLIDYHPKALLLFGSLARCLVGEPGDHLPNDVDLLVVTNNTPFLVMKTDYGCAVELHSFPVNRIVDIARSLRYDSRPVALSKLYSRVLAKEHAIDVIAAAMMLGPAYGDFGIEQIEINGITDTRDYSIKRVLMGEAWWRHLCRYACERRGPLMRFTDKIVRNYDFEG